MNSFTWSLLAGNCRALIIVLTTVTVPNLRDQIIPVFALLQTTKSHLGAWNVFLGVLEVLKLETWLAENSGS